LGATTKERPYRHPETKNQAEACLGGATKERLYRHLSRAKDPVARPLAAIVLDPSLRSG
jgi:hypothetical protein